MKKNKISLDKDSTETIKVKVQVKGKGGKVEERIEERSIVLRCYNNLYGDALSVAGDNQFARFAELVNIVAVTKAKIAKDANPDFHKRSASDLAVKCEAIRKAYAKANPGKTLAKLTGEPETAKAEKQTVAVKSAYSADDLTLLAGIVVE